MREMVATALVGVIGGMLGAAMVLKLKSPTPAEVSHRQDDLDRKLEALLGHDEVESDTYGDWFCMPGATCGRTEEGCAPKCQRRKVVYCGGAFGVTCYAHLSTCAAHVDELLSRHDPDVRMCIGVQ